MKSKKAKEIEIENVEKKVFEINKEIDIITEAIENMNEIRESRAKNGLELLLQLVKLKK